MSSQLPLSVYPTARAWINQFKSPDQAAAASLLDAILLLNEEQVSTALRSQLGILASERRGRRRRVALYAERELETSSFFQVEPVRDASGRMRMRATGRKGPAAVMPARGSPRVGSEGLVAFIISQAKETWPRIFMNHPGPDLIRGKTNPAGAIGLVTDFIGSGSRIRTMLDSLWAVPSVRAWVSRGWVDFKVVAAAATSAGFANVQRHRLQPAVMVQHISPTIGTCPILSRRQQWRNLIDNYGPDAGRGAGKYGFSDNAALIAFNYRLPNNTPALLHQSTVGWHALYEGFAPDDLRQAFGLRSREEVVDKAAADTGVVVSEDLPAIDTSLVLLLSLLRGRWRAGAEVALAERTGLAVPDVLEALGRALKGRLITASGRLTDEGQALLIAGRRSEYKRPTIPTNSEMYYPLALRTPRDSSSTRRPSGRP